LKERRAQMAKTLIDLDEELLGLARHALGTATKKATVNAALREVVRRWAAVEFAQLARGGVLGGLTRDEPVERPCR
jgi:Arc/MetJ family transcription regulator